MKLLHSSPQHAHLARLACLALGLLEAQGALLRRSQRSTLVAGRNHSAASAPEPCDDSDFDSRFDFVITWHTGSPQSFSQRTVNSTDISRFENQREITYVLRSAEKYGLLKFVRNVYIVMNAKEFEEFGPPRDLNFNLPNLHLIKDTDIGVYPPANGYLSKSASFHRIPGISKWFLHVMDDVFLVQDFKVNRVYDFAKKRPYVYMNCDSYIMAWCDGGRAHLTHGPWFASTCRLAELERKYQSRFDETRRFDGKFYTNILADARCLYSNWAAKDGWSTRTSDQSFCEICHTNGHCRSTLFTTSAKSMFVNVQGYGISDDYDGSARWDRMATKWFHTTFPKPSRFEFL